MLVDPALEDPPGFPSCAAHRGSTVGNGLEPHGNPDRLLHDPTSSVGHLLRPLIQPCRVVRNLADRDQFSAGEWAVEAGSHILPVPEDSYVVIITDALRLRTFDRKFLEPHVDAVRDTIGQLLNF